MGHETHSPFNQICHPLIPFALLILCCVAACCCCLLKACDWLKASDWRDRKYTEADFALLEKQLQEDDEEFRPTPEQVQSLKTFYLGKPVGLIEYYVALGERLCVVVVGS